MSDPSDNSGQVILTGGSDDDSVSDHPVGYVMKNVSALQAWFGALVMTGAVVEVFRILIGSDLVEGGPTINGIEYPLVILVPLAAIAVYKHQDHVSLIRPTGKDDKGRHLGFWYGLLDFVPSFTMLAITGIAIASWIALFFGHVIAGVCVPKVDYCLPAAPYTLATTLTAVCFFIGAVRDFKRNHLLRKQVGRAGIIKQNVQKAVPAGMTTIVVQTARLLHGWVLYGRNATDGELDTQNPLAQEKFKP